VIIKKCKKGGCNHEAYKRNLCFKHWHSLKPKKGKIEVKGVLLRGQQKLQIMGTNYRKEE